MKIYFLLMLISLFVGLSYVPLRDRAKQASATAARFRTSIMPNS
jgi:hypothetical protein